MATTDVPGANPANADTLHSGCWSEHKDGSLIFVESTENSQVVYCMFDLKAATQYRDRMPETQFKTLFTWKPRDPKSVRWTWHDKSAFPWDKVLKDFPAGADYPSAGHVISAAEQIRRSRQRHRDEDLGVLDDDDSLTAAGRVAQALHLRGEELDRGRFAHMKEQVFDAGKELAAGIMAGINQKLGRNKPRGKKR